MHEFNLYAFCSFRGMLNCVSLNSYGLTYCNQWLLSDKVRFLATDIIKSNILQYFLTKANRFQHVKKNPVMLFFNKLLSLFYINSL